RTCDLAEKILHLDPKILGLGVYIWNARESLELVRTLKSVRPELIIVLGGPEVSHEVDAQEITALADYTITGEGDLAFATLARTLLANETPGERVIAGGTPPLSELSSPYAYYDEIDIDKRSVYVEAS